MKVANWMIAFTCFLLFIRCAPREIIPIIPTGSEEHKATVLYFHDGSGHINIKARSGFVHESRPYFTSQGIKMEFIDFNFPNGYKGQKARTTDSHFQVIQNKVNNLRKKGHENIWLIGLSNGAISVRFAGASNIQGVKGLIIINPPKESYNRYYRSGVFVDYKKITLPILLVTHEMDHCGLKNWSKQFMRLVYPSSANPEMVTFSGGRIGIYENATHTTDLYQHGLRGVEKEFVQTVINFIDSNSNITEARK